ncbi:hypothetical protein SAMN04488245_101584 [Alloyangia pacifica]|uniref:Uncharacterized protein n=2 Tax=Alloyangia pacifica TaxID=311180 RepID=A0A1I6R0B5_9RHOB|nr:hypothetical protein SAMN04488245_101584 [Alloyangia pacifica]SFS57968.1 hypothetical protein SAMN04488050_102585 [Alloyangia pacifica]
MASASRRLLMKTYAAWIEADEAFRAAQRNLRGFFPGTQSHLSVQIGNRGSRVRQLYNARQRALEKLQLARRQALMEREARRGGARVHLLLVYAG